MREKKKTGNEKMFVNILPMRDKRFEEIFRNRKYFFDLFVARECVYAYVLVNS